MDDGGPRTVKTLFKENLNFEFWGQCIDELKENMFFESENEDPHEHISNITDTIDLFHSPRVSRDQVMLMAFPFTLKERGRHWMKQLSTGSITTWDLFKNAFLRKYRHPSQIIKQINSIRNFEQESNGPLHLTWERFNESLYNYPEHKINKHEQLQIFYQGLDTETRRKVDFKGPIPIMTPAAGIKAITELSRHLLSWDKEGDFKNNDLNIVFRQINNFEQNMNDITEEVRMAQHKYKLPDEGTNSKLEETLRTFIEESRRKQKQNKNLFWKIKKNYDKIFKKQAASIKTIERHLGRIAEMIH
ncbi:reverse transcriptase domain-containing protein [Tanacetum coccineum]